MQSIVFVFISLVFCISLLILILLIFLCVHRRRQRYLLQQAALAERSAARRRKKKKQGLRSWEIEISAPPSILGSEIHGEQKISNGGVGSCAICLEDMEIGMQVRWLPCSHVFHSACIERWLRRKNSCPCCCQKVCRRRHAYHSLDVLKPPEQQASEQASEQAPEQAHQQQEQESPQPHVVLFLDAATTS